MKKNITKFISSLLIPLAATVAHGQTEIWSEDFTGFTSGVQFFAGVGVYTYGFDGETEATFDSNTAGGNNVKPLNSNEWAKTGALSTAFGFNDIGGGNIAAQPGAIGVNASKGIGVVLDGSVFTEGSGSYTLSFDIIGDGGEERNSRVWIGTSDNHDRTVLNGWGLDLSDVSLSDDNLGTPWLLTGAATVSETVSENLVTASSSNYEIAFDYAAGEDVAIVIASANTDAGFDNFRIITTPLVEMTWAGYPIVTAEDGTRWVDTGSDWLGWMSLKFEPFLYVLALDIFVYFPEPEIDSNGAWIYAFR